MNRGYKSLIAGFLIILCAFSLYGQKAPESIKILTIGNSFSRNAAQYLEEIASSVKGCSIEITRANISGCSLDEHVGFIHDTEKDSTIKPYYKEFTLKELLTQDSYDYVTIQQLSLLSFKPESFQPYADELVNYIKKYAPGAKVVVHQTWAYHPDSQRLKKWEMSQSEMYQGLTTNYENLASRYETFLLPSGDAFDVSYKCDSAINLWAKDQYHANVNGQYLAGCVWFATLFDKSPRKVVFFPEAMDEETAKYLKKVAKTVYKNRSK